MSPDDAALLYGLQQGRRDDTIKQIMSAQSVEPPYFVTKNGMPR